MKRSFTIYRYLDRKKILISLIAFVTLVFSCNKKSNDPSNPAAKYCAKIEWTNTFGLSGYFNGVIDLGHYNLLAVDIADQGVDNVTTFHRANGSNNIVNDLPGFTFTYDQGNLVKIVQGDASASATFTFDAQSHLTNTDHETSYPDGFGGSLKLNYTYDSNDDPVKIEGTETSISKEGTSSAEYAISVSYLSDKASFLPLVPEVAPFTSYFAFGNFLSRHLIDRWTEVITVTDEQGKVQTPIALEAQYSYTYDARGYVSTMRRSDSTQNTYTFTYSGCN